MPKHTHSCTHTPKHTTFNIHIICFHPFVSAKECLDQHQRISSHTWTRKRNYIGIVESRWGRVTCSPRQGQFLFLAAPQLSVCLRNVGSSWQNRISSSISLVIMFSSSGCELGLTNQNINEQLDFNGTCGEFFTTKFYLFIQVYMQLIASSIFFSFHRLFGSGMHLNKVESRLKFCKRIFRTSWMRQVRD